ncbi:MAG TPA: hypothetical protein VGP08_20635 [Pyrinomonadaceae bacterium]|jgi:hypothetical protein|nr:hypothetical protein [Pyrinomonadaceae bacterium]
MTQLRLIVGAWLTEDLRWARQNLYALLVLTPLVLGMTYFGVGRMVREAEWSPSDAQVLVACVVAAASLLALSMSRAGLEIYHLRRPESVFDSLPVTARVQLCAALLRRASRTCGVASAALVLRWLAGGGLWDAWALASLALVVCVLASGEVFAAVEWVHWSHRREKLHAVAAVVVSAACALACGLLLSEVLRTGASSSFLSLFGIFQGRAWLLVGAALIALITVSLAFALHGRWRAGDSEFSKRLSARDALGSLGERVARRACRNIKDNAGEREATAAQLARDLQLTLRGFSSAVYVAAGVAALALLLLVALLAGGVVRNGEADGWLSATWLPGALAVKLACVVASVALASLVPVLVAHEQPYLWLERSVGVRGEDAWRAKLYAARVLTLPAATLAWLAGVLCGAVPAFYALPLLAECVWLWWLVSTLAGGLAYEMPEQPGLALILTACATLGAGGLTAFAWPAGLGIYAMGVQQLCMRGHVRAHQHMKGESV